MKRIFVRQLPKITEEARKITGNAEEMTSLTILSQVLEAGGQEKFPLHIMRKALRVLDIIEEAKAAKAEYFDLENSDHEFLKGVLETFPFLAPRHELVAVVEDVSTAKEPPKDKPAAATGSRKAS